MAALQAFLMVMTSQIDAACHIGGLNAIDVRHSVFFERFTLDENINARIQDLNV